MFKCPSCSVAVADERESCPSCGASLDEAFAPTRILGETPPLKSGSGTAHPGHGSHSANPSSIHATFDSIDNARFVAGTLLADRYRIVGLVGRGGMGEVYRAEDLKLSQPVALKLLPERLSMDGAALARFHREVRVARQISHRNVCRVYDIGEAAGLQFLSMEYIRGEELSSVIKRFGRLPAYKAIEISRQICAGLAAAHDAGVLHRDLKPGNVMIDENGNVRITDFGLAGLTEDFKGDVALEGTPEYMSPEQFTGKNLTNRSDIYSLGLVLYEIFTGRKAFAASTVPELIRLRKSDSLPESPSTIVRDVDPLVERVIERCLSPDPKDRPASALQVAAGLPGGDPLAAALAAGETPSPEMVAASPKGGSLTPNVAIALFASAVVLMLLSVVLSARVFLHELVPLEKSAQGLRERGDEIARKFGYSAATDEAFDFRPDMEYLLYVGEHDRSPSRWDRLKTGQPAGIRFWYRRSPRYLMPLNQRRVFFEDPPANVSGMVGIELDTRGRLISFNGVPPQVIEPRDGPTEPGFDWSQLFVEAGLDPTGFRQAEPKWLPPHAFDQRVAWEGSYPGQADMPIRIEAASFRGQPTYFEIVNPWSRPVRQQQFQLRTGARIAEMLIISMFLAIMLASVLLARHNLRLGRGDRRGAARLAVFVFVIAMLTGLLTTHHVPTLGGELAIVVESLAQALLIAGIFWIVYAALEPFLRRRWPGRIIAWNRLLAGDFRDPLVGRDLLIGAVAGFGFCILGYLQIVAPQWLGGPPTTPVPIWMRSLLGFRYLTAGFLDQVLNSMLVPAAFMFILLLFSIFLRREWAGVLAFWIILTALGVLGGENPALDFVFGGISTALTIVVLMRFGMLAMFFTQFFVLIFNFFPITTNLSAWYAGGTIFPLVIASALVLYGFRISLAGQKVFRGALVDD